MIQITNNVMNFKDPDGNWRGLMSVGSGTSGEGSNVIVTPILTTGEKIADITVDGVVKSLYAPEGGGAEIDDVMTSTTKTWSSNKTNVELNKKANYIHDHILATSTASGFMSNTDKAKLDAMVAVSVDDVLSTTSTNAVQNKVITTELNKKVSLDSNGLIPSSVLPSYVDDVLEYANLTNFPKTGETGKIYVDISENKTYRWSGTTYVTIGSSLALGETSSTAYAGDKGKTVADKVATLEGKVNGLATVATSGSYNDLSDKPSLGSYVDKTGDTMTGVLKALDGDIAVAQVRNIYATSTAVTEGVTALPTGSILLVYEE